MQYLQNAGMPSRDEAKTFAANVDTALGASVSPVYPLGGGYTQEFENGSRYLSGKGWFSSPPAVATLARAYRIVPLGALVGGRQDFDVADGFAVFSSPATGTHAVYGAIRHSYIARLGLATSDEYAWQGTTSRAVDFQNGRIVWSPTTGPVVSLKS
ncbi:LGFP repeat-containing protein [Subtercola boreus]|uniref:LGFP repeat-containing protein n=1 Tax=Subtercola boreus TaxID=120213 RepID=UPI0011C02959|nr:hypothetical protein [Subtercola boreus]